LLALVLARRRARTQALADSRERLANEAIESAERERTRLADALHDRPLQNLIAGVHDLRRVERNADPESFRRLRRALENTIAELRGEIFELHPHVLDHVGLDAAIKQLAQRISRDHQVQVTVDLDPAAARFHPDLVFSLARELLSNAAKHAHAGVIGLRLTRQEGFVTLEVSDDGDGIPDGRLDSAVLDGHIGLAVIRERVPALGGRIEVATAPGGGTTIRATLPARRAGDERHEPTSKPAESVVDGQVERRQTRSDGVDDRPPASLSLSVGASVWETAQDRREVSVDRAP
jgi:two-component system NarL family sensor kinase